MFQNAANPRSAQVATDEVPGKLPGLNRTFLPGIGYAYITERPVPALAPVLDLRQYAADVPAPTKYSIQVDVDRHIDGVGTLYLNHSCEPNVFVDARARSVIALRSLSVGEGLTFFYPANEWSMSLPFECQCGTASCIGTVKGAVDLPPEVLRRYRLNPHIVDLMAGMRK